MTKRIKVHEEGNVGISFEAGRLLTWGDSLVKAWPKGLENEAEELECFGDVRHALSIKHENKIYVHVTSESVDTETYEWPSLLEDKNYTLFRFTCDIGCIASLKNAESIQAAAGAGDFKVKWKDLQRQREVTLEGHDAPILSVAIDPRGKLVCSSSCDGFLKIWDLSKAECIFNEKLFFRSSDIEHAKCSAKLEFEPRSGELLAVLVEKGAKIFNRSDNTLLHDIEEPEVPKTLAWSKCGSVLAIALKTVVNFYDTKSFSKIHEICSEENSPITDICFTDKSVLIAEKSGTLISTPTSDFITKEMKGKPSSLPKPVAKIVSEESVAMSVDDEESRNNQFLDEEAGEAGEEEEVDDLEALWDEDAKSETDEKANEEGAMEFDEDSNNAVSLNAVRDSVPMDKPREYSDGEDDDLAGAIYEGPQPSQMQKAFQPGESPNYNASRYLCWNSTGIIKGMIDEQRGISTIIIEFHDVSVHHSVQLANQHDFVLGDMSEQAIILASKGELEGEDRKKSIVKVMNFKSWWDKNREWQVELARREIAEVVCASTDSVAVGTSARNIRMFSHAGAQIRLVTVPGPIVTMSSNLEQLFYVYHRHQGFEGDQYMACGTIASRRIGKKRRTVNIPSDVAISPGAKLAWVGFTDEGTPATYDTTGIVRIIGWADRQWFPIANMTTIKKNFKTVDWWYMISINEGNKEIAAVHCENATYPEVHPRPEVHVMRINMPLVNPKTDISIQESELMINANITGTIDSLKKRGYDNDDEMEELVQKQITKGILKLLLGAIIQDADDRGYEICKLLEHPGQIQMAVRLANNKGRIKLAERLNDLARKRAEEDDSSSEEEEEGEENEEEEDEDAVEEIEEEEVVEQGIPDEGIANEVSQDGSTISNVPITQGSTQDSREAEGESRAAEERLARQKARNPFAQTSTEDDKENDKTTLDELPKSEAQRSKPKTMKDKLARFRSKQKASGAAAKSSKIQSKIALGKRKELSTEEPATKKLKASALEASSDNASGSAVSTSMAMDDFAAGSDSD